MFPLDLPNFLELISLHSLFYVHLLLPFHFDMDHLKIAQLTTIFPESPSSAAFTAAPPTP